ncbi:hypothetical protein [Actinomadura darangshiensis]|uniref:hypothetical protein n=1 Tax=Actinomadura darangshiensis TaxID=705336 RepID=UPI00140CAACD|nr:hypothetical protein [Actinomadura darangshiensis]
MRAVCGDFEVEFAEFNGEGDHEQAWSDPCFAGSARGAPISVLRQYIEQQNYPA